LLHTDPDFRSCGIIEFRVDTRNEKFIMTPIMDNHSEGPVLDVTEMYEKFHREYGDGRRARG
jgi:hypothetical protein